MLTPFSPEKLTQAAAVLFKQLHEQRVGRMKLLKLLYIADREALAETARPITGDSVVAMEQGPVLSQTYDFIKGDPASLAWDRSFRNVGDWHLVLSADPGDDLLSDYEVSKLESVIQRYGHTDRKLSELTHGFSEWIKNQPDASGSRRISIRDRLEAVDLGEDADTIIKEAEKRRRTQSVFAAP